MKKVIFTFIYSQITLLIFLVSLFNCNGQVTIWSEGFEGSLSDYTMLSEVSKDCYWGDVSCKSHSGSWSLWCADDGTDAPTTNCSDYPNNMRANVRKTYASYINSDNYSSITFKFWIWFDIGSNDEIEIYTYDISGQSDWVLKGVLNGDHSWNDAGWHQVSIDLTGVDYFAFKIVFDSNSFSDNEQGVYIDDMELIGTPPIHEVYNAWWSGEVDNNNNNYTQYRKLYFDVDISSGSNEIWAKVWKEKTNGTSGAWYAETSNFTISGNNSGDNQYIEVGIPNDELSYGSYNFGIQIYDSETNEILALYDWNDDTDLNNEKFETQVEDTPPPDITITNANVTPTSVCPGGTIDVSCEQRISNGSSTTIYSNVAYYLSTNATYTTSDTYLGEDQSSLSSSDTYDEESANLTIPSGTSPGTYYVCFIGDYLDEVSESDEDNNRQYVEFTVSSCPEPVANFSGTPTSGCASLAVDFTDQSSDAKSWSWNFGDGGTSTQQNPSHTYSSVGTYIVSLTATNANGSDTETKTNYITVNSCPAPVADFSGTPTSGCASLTVDFTDQSSDATSWSWNFGDGGTSTQQNPSHTYSSVGTYIVSLTATNANGSDTETKTNYITVNSCPAPVADFSGTPTSGCASLTVDFTDQSSDATSWSWNFGDGGTSTQQNPSHTYSSVGTYIVSLTATNANGSNTETKSSYITANNCTGIDKTENLNSIKIYPNPTDGTLTFESDIELGHIEIYDMIGRLVYKSRFKQEIDISHFNDGVYLLKLYSKKENILKTKKIIVNK